ncbi:hypothetical protein E2C01_036235 [Portunus trituberculatus]|uniref:Uncharacterized protein n=1 Tax=Portunus trituberculatus TaxID=210409 RepID=A0A5B7F697_PORTR|nr:hypothetical protein [Portunus trituberculatus]
MTARASPHHRRAGSWGESLPTPTPPRPVLQSLFSRHPGRPSSVRVAPHKPPLTWILTGTLTCRLPPASSSFPLPSLPLPCPYAEM